MQKDKILLLHFKKRIGLTIEWYLLSSYLNAVCTEYFHGENCQLIVHSMTGYRSSSDLPCFKTEAVNGSNRIEHTSAQNSITTTTKLSSSWEVTLFINLRVWILLEHNSSLNIFSVYRLWTVTFFGALLDRKLYAFQCSSEQKYF